ncbi:hypothetical protein EJ08DRAFT_651227 [Tothia fuscella]|uniref:Uncharacterized protein n=1 Tax=Tothia fuscella TaxID=1048955 RepID=A0A9P4TWZ8_9PEZI|nr:hypothetical protein EJ08DRAFT_651227 [Tothia fuscella]
MDFKQPTAGEPPIVAETKEVSNVDSSDDHSADGVNHMGEVLRSGVTHSMGDPSRPNSSRLLYHRFAIFVSTTCWNAYFSPFFQVVNGLTVSEASYLVQGGTVVQIVSGIFAGSIISYTGRYKPISLYFAFPLMVLGMGSLIHFRKPDHYVGFIAMSNIFVCFGWGTLMLTVEIGILGAVGEQQYFAISIALLNLFCYIGNAVGFTVSSAIWQSVFPQKLALYLPQENQANATVIFGPSKNSCLMSGTHRRAWQFSMPMQTHGVFC